MVLYEQLRQEYRPAHIKLLLIAESPPPSAEAEGSRHFYRTDRLRLDDRLFINTIKALYPETADFSVTDLEEQKEHWLQRLQQDGTYMIEALTISQQHEVPKKDRQAKIAVQLPDLVRRVGELAEPDTKIILIKSNVFDVAAEPLRKAGFTVLNTELVDYPGQFNQRAYREKLQQLTVERS